MLVQGLRVRSAASSWASPQDRGPNHQSRQAEIGAESACKLILARGHRFDRGKTDSIARNTSALRTPRAAVSFTATPPVRHKRVFPTARRCKHSASALYGSSKYITGRPPYCSYGCSRSKRNVHHFTMTRTHWSPAFKAAGARPRIRRALRRERPREQTHDGWYEDNRRTPRGSLHARLRSWIEDFDRVIVGASRCGDPHSGIDPGRPARRETGAQVGPFRRSRY